MKNKLEDDFEILPSDVSGVIRDEHTGLDWNAGVNKLQAEVLAALVNQKFKDWCSKRKLNPYDLTCNRTHQNEDE